MCLLLPLAGGDGAEEKRSRIAVQVEIRESASGLNILKAKILKERTLTGPRLSKERNVHGESGCAQFHAPPRHLCAPLRDLRSAWQSVPVEFQRRFQLIALPAGYVFGSIGTAQRGRLFSLLASTGVSKSTFVPLTGLCWNQLANEIEAFAAIFRETSERVSD